jgi:hypothetical protein
VNNLQCSFPTMAYPSTTTFVMSQDPVSSSATVNIGVERMNDYATL